MINPRYPQPLCDTTVFDSYYVGGPNIEFERIIEKIASNIDDFLLPVYIGITHHPCGRFTGNYNIPSPLPSHMNEAYNYQNDNLITETPHYTKYQKMFVVTYVSTDPEIRQLEIDVIARMRKDYGVSWVLNSSDGGEGDLSISERYYLYICHSNLIKS